MKPRRPNKAARSVKSAWLLVDITQYRPPIDRIPTALAQLELYRVYAGLTTSIRQRPTMAKARRVI